jgi:hypothetical protein
LRVLGSFLYSLPEADMGAVGKPQWLQVGPQKKQFHPETSQRLDLNTKSDEILGGEAKMRFRCAVTIQYIKLAQRTRDDDHL